MKKLLLSLGMGFLFLNSNAQIDYASQIQSILNAKCASCHGGRNGVSLQDYEATMNSKGSSYNKLIVTAGDAVQSPLYDKLLANPQFGSRMPQGGSLSSTEINLIKDWINQGATKVATSVEDDFTPSGFALLGNYPNPFNPATTIQYSMPSTTNLTIDVIDIMGRQVATLHNGVQVAGVHTLNWDASKAASGIYLIRMQTGSQVFIRKVTLLK